MIIKKKRKKRKEKRDDGKMANPKGQLGKRSEKRKQALEIGRRTKQINRKVNGELIIKRAIQVEVRVHVHTCVVNMWKNQKNIAWEDVQKLYISANAHVLPHVCVRKLIFLKAKQKRRKKD